MSEQTTEFQARIYLYDLNNCAREFGFKTDESWEISMVSQQEKTALEKKYFPTLSARLSPELLPEVLSLVKLKLNPVKAGGERTIAAVQPPQQELQYLVAYSAKRLRG